MIGSVALGVYRILSDLARPAFAAALRRRAMAGKEDRTRLGERRGESTLPRPAGALVWIHGASVGETNSLLPLVQRLTADRIRVLLTSGTVTSARLMARRLPPGAIHQFVPLDCPTYVRRFLDHWQPDLAIFAESELWPNLIASSDDRGIPLVLVNARMSPRSFARWSRFAPVARAVLSRFDLCLAQTEADAGRLGALGAPRVAVTGNLKYDVPPPPADPLKLAALEGLVGGRPIWMAASTHPGEERILLATHERLVRRYPHLLTIIAPRHPDRGAMIEGMARASGLRTARRSLGLQPDRSTDVYIVDTMGELGLFYRLVPLAFMGGTLVPHGGQNPIEPAKLGAAVLHGPHVHNFLEVFAALDGAGGAVPVTADELFDVLDELLGDPSGLRWMARAAAGAVSELGGAVDRTMDELAPFVVSMHLGGR
jgi:3-deoxy-D-manno-octulosonic-acid transferase